MKTELVHSNRGDVFTSSVIIAEQLEVKHAYLLRTLDIIVKKWEKQVAGQQLVSIQKFKETTFENKMGRTYKMYELNEPAFAKLVMSLSGYEKAEFIQDLFIQEFYRMKNALLNKQNMSWIEKRDDAKLSRRE